MGGEYRIECGQLWRGGVGGMGEREYSAENRSRSNYNTRPETEAQPSRKGLFGSRRLDFSSAGIHESGSSWIYFGINFTYCQINYCG
jgi:hypothetical protein